MKPKQRVVILAVLFTGIDLLDAQETVPAEPPATQNAQTDRRIRFNFEHQPWTEVLQFLADQADLSLVLDSPPEGSFNYSDSRDYGPREAIDLVNGVLATKGYTLLRREKMLMLVNLQSGVPKTLVPRITIEELDRRGQFELVKVIFPLSKRNLDTTVSEVTPLLSNYGEISPLPASQQLLVTDRAGVVRAIKAAIDSIPLPKKSSRPQPQKPELRVYPLEGADPVATIEMLNALVESKLVHDPVAKTINANATPSEHALLEKVIEQMQGNAETSRYRMEVYPLEGVAPGDATQLINDLSLVKKNGQIRYDENRKGLVVWADAFEQAEIRRTLLRLLASISTGGRPSAKVYVLEHGDPAAIEAAVRSVMPQVRLMHFADSSRILAIATTEDHNEIAVILEQLDHQVKPAELKVQIYNLKYKPLPSLPEVLKRIVPKAEVMVEQDVRRVTVTATSKDQAAIAQVIKQLDLSPPTSATNQVVAYAVTRSDMASMLEIISEIAPAAKAIADTKGRRVLVWATAKDHQAIAPIVQPTAATNRETGDLNYRAYPATGIDSSLAIELLSDRYPAAEFMADSQTGTIVAKASNEQQLQIAVTLETLRRGASSNNIREVQVYPLGQTSPEKAQALASLFPTMALHVDSTLHQIAALGTRTEHDQLRTALNSVRDGVSDSTRRVKLYNLGEASSSIAAQLLAPIVPGATMVPDPASKTLGIWATDDQHAQLQSLIDQWLEQQSAKDLQEVLIVELEHARATDILSVMREILPNTMVTSVGDKQLVIRGNMNERELATGVIRQTDVPQAGENLQMKIYPVTNVKIDEAMAAIKEYFGSSFNDIRFVVQHNSNRVIVFAKDEEQTKIADIFKQLQLPEKNLEVFRLQIVDPVFAESAINELFMNSVGLSSDVTVEVDEDNGQLLVKARPDDLEKVREVLVQLGEIALLTENDEAANQNSRFVPLEYGFTEDLLTQLRAHWNKMAPNELQVLRAGALNSSQVDNQAQPDEPTQNTEDSAPSPADESSTGTGPPPVTLVANVDGVTIMSDDTEAVFKLERLLRAMSRQTFAARVDFSVFNLKHSSASRVSKLLSEIYATSNRLPFSDRVRVTADDRLNSIVVFGSRSKRREVGALLQALDSKQFADLTVPGPPVMIQLQYASAEQVEEKLQALYKTQLSVVGGRPPIEIPPGADPQVVATLQQINAAREGPLLSLEVDQASNSLLVVGTDPLVQEIRTFAEQLDHETAQSRVGIRVVPLETLRGEEVVKSLQKLFNK